VLCILGACSGGASPAAHGTASPPAVSAAPVAPPGLPSSALERLHWTALPADPLAPRDSPITAWTGREFLAVGGAPVGGNGPALTGADAYDPKAGRWNLLPSFPLAARNQQASAWTGYGLVVWGGTSTPSGHPEAGHALRDGAILDVTQRRWSTLPAGPLPALSSPVAVTDAADQVIILGGATDKASLSMGLPVLSRLVARYDPATRTWRSLPALPAVSGHDVVEVSAVRWGTRVLVAQAWQHVEHPVPGGTTGTGGVDFFRLDPTTGRWSPFHALATPLYRADLRPVASSLVLGGGSACPLWADCALQLHSPFTVLDSHGHVVSGVVAPPIVLTAETVVGNSYVAMTGAGRTGTVSDDQQPGDAAAFDLTTNRWVALPSARRLLPQPESLTWTGSELIAQSPVGLIALGPH